MLDVLSLLWGEEVFNVTDMSVPYMVLLRSNSENQMALIMKLMMLNAIIKAKKSLIKLVFKVN